MRVTPGISDRNFLTNIGTLNEKLEEASQQVSTGKKLVRLSDSPSGSAELVGLRDELSQIDQYRANSSNGNYLVGISDSVLSSVHDLVTSIFTAGSSAAGDTTDSAGRATITKEIRSMRDQLFSMANTQIRGRYLFAGSKVTAPAFTISGDAVTYQGDQEVNKIDIGDGVVVRAGVAGSDVFSPVFQTVNNLLTALDSNDTSAIQTALGQFESSLRLIREARGQLGGDLSRLQGITTEQDLQETAVKTRQSSLEDANMAQALTQLNQLQTALQATLTAQSASRRSNLFDYLG